VLVFLGRPKLKTFFLEGKTEKNKSEIAHYGPGTGGINLPRLHGEAGIAHLRLDVPHCIDKPTGNPRQLKAPACTFEYTNVYKAPKNVNVARTRNAYRHV